MGSVSSPWRRARGRAGRIVIAAVLSAGVLAGALLASQTAGAQSVSELRSNVGSAQAKAERMAAQIESQTSALEASRTEALAAAEREAELNATLAQGQERAAELSAAVDEAKSSLQQAKRDLRGSVATLSSRLVEIYKHGGVDEVELLLSSSGYDDLATRSEYLERIRAADAALVDRTRELRAEVASQLDEVAGAEEAQLAHNAEVAAARDQIAAVRARAESQTATLVEARTAQQSALGELQGEVQRWQREIQQAEQVSAQEAEEQVTQTLDDWAIPASIVECESGGDYTAVNPSSGAGGAYQIMPSTWEAYGGEGLPQNASPAEQDRIAAMIWADSGGSAWVCAG